MLAVPVKKALGNVTAVALEPDTAESEVDEIAAEILDECRAHKIRTPRDG